MGARRLRWIIIPAIVFALAFGLVGQAVAAGDEGPGQPGRCIVTIETAVNETARAQIERLGGVIIKQLPIDDSYVVLIPGAAINAVERIPGVIAVEQAAVVHTMGKPPWAGPKTDQPPETAWGVDRIDADLVWDTTNTGANIEVAVLDTGIDVDHPDLNVAGGYNAITTDDTEGAADDDNGHGTHVAGIIAALKDTGENTGAVTGVAPDASLYAVKVLNSAGSGYLDWIIDGIYWAIGEHVDVINMSLGIDKQTLDQYPIQNAAFQKACDDAYAAGIVVVAAAGNDGNPPGKGDNIIYPARYASVIAVAATNQDDERPKWSSTGPALELSAPGADILSTWNDGEYEPKSGTSMASPHVAGTVALMLAANPGLTPVNVRAILTNTADDLGATGWDSKYGEGLVDAEEAVTGIETP